MTNSVVVLTVLLMAPETTTPGTSYFVCFRVWYHSTEQDLSAETTTTNEQETSFYGSTPQKNLHSGVGIRTGSATCDAYYSCLCNRCNVDLLGIANTLYNFAIR